MREKVDPFVEQLGSPKEVMIFWQGCPPQRGRHPYWFSTINN